MRAVFIKTQFLFLALAAMAGPAAFAGAPPIGIITASGHFTLESSVVWGNSTLFDGATVQTDRASSQMALRNGVKLELGAASKAKIFSNRTVLEKGTGIAAGNYEIDAAGLLIKSEGARMRVVVTDRIEVAALSGVARVSGTGGFLLASIPAGRAMSFSPQAGATATVARTGCLLYKDGHFILQDENTQEVSELSGSDPVIQNLRANTGNRVEVAGAMTGAKPAVTVASGVMSVNSVTQKSQGGCLSAAAALTAQTEAPAGAGSGSAAATPAATGGGGGGGLSTGAKAAIILGIAGGGGAAAALALAGKKSSTSP
jgi:hypothetical protein